MTTIDLEKIHLDKGAHDSPEEGMCFIEAVAFIRRAEDSSVPFNDAPMCVSPVLRAFGKFAPVREQLQASAHQLFRSMVEVAA
jgi:hypothetical protein